MSETDRRPGSKWPYLVLGGGCVLLVGAFAVIVFLVPAAQWVMDRFNPDKQPQKWTVVSTAWGPCVTQGFGTNVPLINTCEAHGTLRNDGGTGADRYLAASPIPFPDLFQYTVNLSATADQACGVDLDTKTHHGKTVTVSCRLFSLGDLNRPLGAVPPAIATDRPPRATITKEDIFAGAPSA